MYNLNVTNGKPKRKRVGRHQKSSNGPLFADTGTKFRRCPTILASNRPYSNKFGTKTDGMSTNLVFTMKFSLIAIAAVLSGANGDLRHEERARLMNGEMEEHRQLKGMKKSKVNGRRVEKQRKNKIRDESSAKYESKPPKQKKTNASPKTLPSGANYVTTEGAAETSPTVPKDTIGLGNKRPIGIARGPDDTMYVTEMLYGGVKKVNILNGEVEQVVPSYGFRERGARGIVLEQNHLFVAGGGVPDGTPLMMYVYDAYNGEEITSCAPPGSDDWYLLNDIAIHGDYAYLTDPYYNKLLVMDVAAALKGTCNVSSIKTPCPCANGIVPYANGLLIARTEPGGIFYVDLMDEDLPFMEIATLDVGPYGLAIDGNILYSAESTENTISFSSLTESLSLQSLGKLEASDFDYPTAAAIYDKYLCTVNARITSLPINGTAEGALDFKEEFSMSCVDRSFDE